jgi:protein O-GlcNAc transferase
MINSAQTIQQSLHQAVQNHTAGRLAQAEQLYRHILQADPNQPDALHLLGVLAHQTGNSEAAVELIGKAIMLKPEFEEAQNNLGLALQALGNLDTARDSFLKAVALKPDYAEAHSNLGNVLMGLGKMQDAEASFRQALAIKPDYVKACNNMGLALRDLGRLDEAIDTYQQAVSLSPDFFEAHSNLGNALKEQGWLTESLNSFRAALAIKPDYAEAHNNMGLTLMESGQVDQAKDCYTTAISLKPDYAEAFNNLGNAQQLSGSPVPALDNFNRAISLNPDFAEAQNNLGSALVRLGKLEEAIVAYKVALRIQPDFEHAAANLLHQLRHACAWSEIEQLDAQFKDGSNAAISPFENVTSSANPSQNLAVAQAESRRIADKVSDLKSNFNFSTQSSPTDKITIGYLSCDFQDHATAHLMLSLFALHNRDDFNIFTFSYGQDDDSHYRTRIVADSDRFFDLVEDDYLQAAEKIAASGVDILVDLKGHTHNNRLEICALRPAPVQVSYLGFPGTTGADFMDYFITDPVVTPEDQVAFYSEKLVCLPHTYQATDNTQQIADVPLSRSDCGLPDDGFVFCSFNGNFKIEAVLFDVWMRLLDKTPGSVLWLYNSNDLAKTNLKREAAARGVDPDRLVFAAKVPKDQHLARYRLADLALDTRTCGGHTTTSDALWAGLPVLTMQGKHFASRVSASLLSAIGMPELITRNLEDYEALALELAQHPGKLAGLEAKLASNRLSEPLFDTPRFVKNLEAAYRRMWEVHTSGHPPTHITVVDEHSQD